MGNSEIARIRQQIADEYQAAHLGLYGLAVGTCRHQFITTRMDLYATVLARRWSERYERLGLMTRDG